MKKYLVFDVGCLECGQDSQPVGIFDTKEEAEQSKKSYINNEPNEFGTSWGRAEWFGQHDVSIYEVEV